MTLHEAIAEVLQRKGPSTSREIADEVNRLRLYQRKCDDNPVPASQISARVNKYPTLFHKENGFILLNKRLL